MSGHRTMKWTKRDVCEDADRVIITLWLLFIIPRLRFRRYATCSYIFVHKLLQISCVFLSREGVYELSCPYVTQCCIMSNKSLCTIFTTFIRTYRHVEHLEHQIKKSWCLYNNTCKYICPYTTSSSQRFQTESPPPAPAQQKHLGPVLCCSVLPGTSVRTWGSWVTVSGPESGILE